MTSWEISIPFRGEDDFTLDVIPAPREVLEGDELRVVEQLAYDASIRGKLTVGELLSELETIGSDGRRRLLDAAREAVGLDSISEIEQAKSFARVLRDDPPRPSLPYGRRDEQGMAVQQCPHCAAVSSTPEGALRPAPEKRWHCDRHRDLAEPGDLDPLEPEPLKFAPGGGFALPQAEQEAAARHEEQLIERVREKARIRQEQREAGRERLEELKRRRHAEQIENLPPGLEWMRPPE